MQRSHPGARQGDPRRREPGEPGGVRVDRNVPSLGLVIPQGSRLEIKPHEDWIPKQAETIRLWQQRQDTLPLPELARRSASPLKPPPLKAWYQYKCEDPRQQDQRDKQGHCQPTECSGHCPGNGRAHGARPVSRARRSRHGCSWGCRVLAGARTPGRMPPGAHAGGSWRSRTRDTGLRRTSTRREAPTPSVQWGSRGSHHLIRAQAGSDRRLSPVHRMDSGALRLRDTSPAGRPRSRIVGFAAKEDQDEHGPVLPLHP